MGKQTAFEHGSYQKAPSIVICYMALMNFEIVTTFIIIYIKLDTFLIQTNIGISSFKLECFELTLIFKIKKTVCCV